MAALPDLSRRRVEPEWMDSPALERRRHLDALDALARVNAVSLAAPRVWAEVRRLAHTGVQRVRVLDVACGGGDVLRNVAARARRFGLEVELCGLDVSPVALDRAREAGGDVPEVRFVLHDVLQEPLPTGFHLVCSSLFIHHLEGPDAARLLRAMGEATERVLLVQDLRRTWLGYLFAWAGLGVLTRSEVARNDGLVSVAAALTLAEAEALCREAGLDRAVVEPCWPQRFTVRWERRP